MKVFFLINSSYPRYAGGIENWLFNVSQRLCDKHEVVIVSHERSYYPMYYSNINASIKIVNFRTLRSWKFLNRFIKSYVVLFDIYLGSLIMGRVLKRLLSKEEPSIVIALDSLFCLNAGFIAKSEGTKVVSSVRGPHAEILGLKYSFFAKTLLTFEQNLLSKADQIWANGYDTKAALETKGFHSKLIENGFDFKGLAEVKAIDYQFDQLVENKISVVSVGTLLPIKGIYELLDAAEMLVREKKINIHFVFIGKGNKYNFLEYASKKGISDNVHFVGHKNNPIGYIKKCNIAVCLSGGAGMSMVAIEAMASGVPIIAWDSPVYRQFNRKDNFMLLVEEKNPEALAKGIMKVVGNYDYYQNIGQKAKSEAKNYDWSVICERIEEIFNYDFKNNI